MNHTHGNGEPCRACFADYIERNGGLPTSPMDLPGDENEQEEHSLERES